ncbi:hypothetical protein NEUTE2DRAFT_127057 [Neurospora tetrasperma FGSC 2509]|nr:hypothetical protein NEUTE2DRAFT_127057 [Neurospora tetrasperma FGSC 2509]
MAATAFTAITTIISTVFTSIQSAPVLTPTATTTGHISEPSMTTNASPDSSNSSSPAPKPWVSEPYYSGTSFLASVANIFYMIEEQEWKEETRYHQIQQTNGINKMAELTRQLVTNQRIEEKAMAEARDHQTQQIEEIRKMVELLGSVVLENNGLKEENKVLCQRLEDLESRMEGREATKGLIEGMERMTDSMRSVVTAVQGLKRVFRVGLDALDNRTRAVDYKVDWMLDYHLDENERFHTLKVILQGLLDLVGSTSPATSTAPQSSWGEDPAKTQIVVDKSGWEEDHKPW